MDKIRKFNSEQEALQRPKILDSFIIRDLPNGGQKKEPIFYLTKTEVEAFKGNDSIHVAMQISTQLEKALNVISDIAIGSLDKAVQRIDERVDSLQRQTDQNNENISMMLGMLQSHQKNMDELNNLVRTDNGVTTSELAAEFGLSASRLNTILHYNKIIYPAGSSWVFYQRYKKSEYGGTEFVKAKSGQVVRSFIWTTKGVMVIRAWFKDHPEFLEDEYYNQIKALV